MPPAHLAPDAEVVAGGGDEEHVDRRVALGEYGGLLEAVVHLDSERVAALGAVDDHAQRAVDPGGLQVARAQVERCGAHLELSTIATASVATAPTGIEGMDATKVEVMEGRCACTARAS
ncbi:MAG: hypothetical protein AUI36_18375 [Cyanobacteria bacterium 13_1_40CM_2_61_4]|nr:MAG: hypothetical protein AUI36_18375 [Cyanobacteria bacterium 13_1_40CM_2_61_4]